MEPATTLRFAATARALAHEARARGLAVPGFRSPPRSTASTARCGAGVPAPPSPYGCGARPWADVLVDMIEGVVVANGL